MAYHRRGLNVERGTILVTSPYREVPIRACYQNRVRYRTAGKGQTSRLALYDPERFPDIRATLEAALGPLVAFEVLDPEPKAEPENKPTASSEAPTAISEAEPRPRREYRRPYQPDLFGAPVVDLDEYRGGKLPANLAMAVKATYRARVQSQSQFAFEIGLSQPQLCNALRGRFGLSVEAADRLRSWVGDG